MQDSDTLRLLGEAAAGLVKPDGKRVRELRGIAPGFDQALWRSFAEQGWLAILVPEAQGGLDLGLDAACVVAERLGYAARPEPYVAAGLMAPYLLAHANGGATRARLLPRVLAGETLAVTAWQNESGSLRPADTQVTARIAGETVTLSGQARLAPLAAADAFIVLAAADDGPGLYWVERNLPGLDITAEPTPEGGAQGWLRFNNVRLPVSLRLAGPERAADLLAAAVDFALIATSAELVGLMERELELTLDYLRTRKQFGAAIGSFQALQHRAVDLWMQKELSRHATRAAARAADAPGVTASARALAASGAKSRAADAALLVGKQAIQLHGAIGFTDEYDLGLSVNRSLTLAAWLGNAAEHRRLYGELAAAR